MEPEYEKSEGPGWWILGILTISLFLGLALLLMVGCQPRISSMRADSQTVQSMPIQSMPFQSMPPIQQDQLLLVSADGTYRVILDFPEDPPENEEFEVTGTVYQADGLIDDSVSASFDAGMPHHGHGLALEVETRREPAGRFATPGVRFHMKGRWLLTVDMTSGPHLERARAWIRVN